MPYPELKQRKSLRVAVLLGGDSAEREISLRSGQAVLEALTAAGHWAAPLDPLEQSLAAVDWARVDVAFIALHGGAGEDGRLQRQLDTLGVPYTGSGARACHRAMHKHLAKQRFRAAGVPTPEAVLLTLARAERSLIKRAARLGFPLVIKPDAQGSSLGVSRVDVLEQVPAALAACRPLGLRALAERYVAGRELTVAVLGRRPLPLLEIAAPDDLFTYAAKYQAGATRYELEVNLPPAAIRNIQHQAVAACRALGTRGLARVDLRLDSAGQPWVLEVNTVPGLTARSLAPKAAACAGLELPALCDRLVRTARCARAGV